METLQRVGQFDHVVGILTDELIAFSDECCYPSATCPYLLNVRDDFFIESVVGGDDEYWHLRVDEGNGSMLHFCSRIALGMNIGNLLQLQRTLQGQWIVVAAAEIEAVLCIGENHCQACNLLIGLQRLPNLLRDERELFHHFAIELVGNGLALAGKA